MPSIPHLPRFIRTALATLMCAAPLLAFEDTGPLDNLDPKWRNALSQSGPPIVDVSGVLFRFTPPKQLDVARVHLAGSFNAWAGNDDGVIRGSRFTLQETDSGVWYKWIDLPQGPIAYQYVVETTDGEMIWMADQHVAEREGGNSVLQLANSSLNTAASPDEASLSSPGLQLSLERVWVEPGASNTLTVKVDAPQAGMRLQIRLLTPLGDPFYLNRQAVQGEVNKLSLPPVQAEGGFVVVVTLEAPDGSPVQSAHTILSVTSHPEDDLRYGFFATYPDGKQDYPAKAAMLADLHINAVEFYDYFPAHGDYAPDETHYLFEPFDIAINGNDVKAKISACQERGILALAYIAAYAASESVYRSLPDPMTDEHGSPKIFNGRIMSETEADANDEAKWFWLMNISENARWRDYILPELKRALTGGDSGIAAFDGFEIDTYGDNANERFYAKGSPQDGEPLADVLQGFVLEVTEMTHQTKAHGLVSFNSVNEFGVENMYSATDFLFLELWSWHAPLLSDLVDVCYHHRSARNQRVVLKLYPADMAPPLTTWPTLTLPRILGATMTGGGSLMVVGEPDEATGTMHALNSLFYPDHQPLSQANYDVLQRYYQHDAMLYGYTHGRHVENWNAYIPVAGCLTRAFHAPKRRAICLQLLNIGNQRKWTEAPFPVPAKQALAITFKLPEGIRPQKVYYASPDSPAHQLPKSIPFEQAGDKLTLTVPKLINHGSVIVQY